MSISLELYALITSEEGEIGDHLDDTLLSRLETTLYCNNECHEYLWNEFHETLFRKFMDNFEDCLGYASSSLEKLKIKFSILNKMKKHCGPEDFAKVNKVLSTIVLSKDCKVISMLERFLIECLHCAPSNEKFFFGMTPYLPTVKFLYQTSPNVNHRRSLLYLLCLILLSNLSYYRDFEEAPALFNSRMFKFDECNFIIDLAMNMIRFSITSNLEAINSNLRCYADVVKVFLDGNPNNPDDDIVFLMIVLSHFNLGKFTDYLIDHVRPSYKVGYILRRLVSNKIFEDSELHRKLVNLWCNQLEECLNISSVDNLVKLVSPLSTCQIDFAEIEAFKDCLTPQLVKKLWGYSFSLLLSGCLSRHSRKCWLLFSRICHLQDDSTKRLQCTALLDQICKKPRFTSELSVVIDCVRKLYHTLDTFTSPERLSVYQRFYDLAHDECSNLKSSGGNLSYTFTLLQFYEYSLSSESVALQLLDLQRTVSNQIAEQPSLIANETIIEVHRGIFLMPLLESQAREVFTPQLCSESLDLCHELHHNLIDTGDDMVYPGTLKGVLLACLLRCFCNLAVINFLELEERLQEAIDTCYALGIAEWEEDPSIRRRILASWNEFSRQASEGSVKKVDVLVKRLKPRFDAFVKPAEIGGVVCPSCRECIRSLLGDIVVSTSAAYDLDCIGD